VVSVFIVFLVNQSLTLRAGPVSLLGLPGVPQMHLGDVCTSVKVVLANMEVCHVGSAPSTRTVDLHRSEVVGHVQEGAHVGGFSKRVIDRKQKHC